MRTHTLLLFAFVALLGAAVAVPAALAAPLEVKLDVNENCNGFSQWQCWTLPEGSPTYAHSVTIASGGKLTFADNDTTTPFTTDVVWTAGSPMCTGVPNTPMSDWEGSCEFKDSGTYKFESINLFEGTGIYSDDNYTKYEVIVAGPPTPTATTEQAAPVAETEARLNGDVNPEGQATSYYFEYGTTPGYGSTTTETSVNGSGARQVSATLTGLPASTTYYFQLVAVYGAGKTKVEGGNMTFKTAAPPSAPTASTQSATGVSETEATLKGTINPDGEETEYFFEYGTETSYGQKTREVTLPASENNQAVPTTVRGLVPGTQYHFRVVAKNKLGSIQGNDLTFMTASTPPTKEPPAKEPSPTPTPTPTGGNPTATTSDSPSSGQPKIEAASGPLFGSLKLTSTQHGAVVHGSLVVSSTGSEGQLQIELLSKGITAPVDKLVRSSLHAGKLSFSLPLNAQTKRTLRHRHKLALTIKIVLTPKHGAAVTITRTVILHA